MTQVKNYPKWGVGRRAIAALRLGTFGLALTLPLSATAFESSLTAPGAPGDLADSLRNSSATLAAKTAGLVSPQEILAAALADYRTLVQVLYDAGYFSPVVHIRLDGREAASIPQINPPPKVDKAEIMVTPGPLFRFGTARVAPLAPGTEMPKGFVAGAPAGTGTIREAAIAGRDGWREIGHAKAQIGEQKIIANHPAARLDADIRLVPGQKYRFGTLSVSGNSKVRTEAIQRIGGLPWNETFSPEDVQKVGARLRRTGAFASVSIVEAETGNPDGTLNFEAQVTEQLPRRITFGVEVQSRAGAILSGSFIHRNLFGAAERLRVDAEIRNIGGTEDIDGRFAFRLDNPARLGRDNNLFYMGAIERFDRENYTLNQMVLGVGVKRVFSDELFAEASLLASINDADDAYGSRRFRLLSLPFHAQWDRRDSQTDATSGFFLDGTITPFAGFGGSTSGVQATMDARAYYSVTESGSVVLAGRVTMGSVFGGDPSEISPDLLFFSGGAGTVRGQPFESLGIPVGTGLAGGKSIFTASAEVRGRVTPKIGLVAFFDYGAVDSSTIVGSGALTHSGAGIGLRYDLGAFGPIRLDLALPVSGSTKDGLQFYLGIGQAF